MCGPIDVFQEEIYEVHLAVAFLCSNSLFRIMSLSIASAAAPVNKVFFHAFYNKEVHLGK